MKLIKEFIAVTIGTLVLTFGITMFLIPSGLAVGGITGFAMIMNKIFPQFTVGSIMMMSNVVLYILGFVLIGKQFGAKTIYASFTLSGLIWLFEKLIPIQEPLVDDLFLNLFFGILITGVGLSIVFYQNASTGGTDIIAKIINKFFNIEIGKSLLIADFLVVSLAIKYYGLESGLYALFGVIMNAYLIDNIIEGLNIKINVVVITSKTDILKKFILEELNRGASLYRAEGGYTNQTQNVISTVLSKREFIRIKAFIKEIDSNAFVTASSVREVIGEGFNRH